MSDMEFAASLTIAPLIMLVGGAVRGWLERRKKRRFDAAMAEYYRDWPKNANRLGHCRGLEDLELEIERLNR